MRFSFKLTTCGCALIIGLLLHTSPTFAATLLKVGVRGSEVSKLQQTLADKGYFNHSVTGYYGYITKNSVIRFQTENGLSTDGIAGPKTLGRLYSTYSSMLKIGSRGNEVTKLQQSLTAKGYFSHSATGYYGSITKNAVIRFQRDTGLAVDGIAGPKTLNALYNTDSSQTASTNNQDIYWLSRIIEAEAKGESYTGKLAVGNVVMNRVKSSLFPNSVKSVIFEYYKGIPMFSPVQNGTIYNTPSQESINAAYAAYSGQQPVGNATYFFNPDTASSSWISKNKTYVTRIGRHVFYA